MVKGANLEGVNDLEPEESAQWHELTKDWQQEHQRPDVQPPKFGLPLKSTLSIFSQRLSLIESMIYGL